MRVCMMIMAAACAAMFASFEAIGADAPAGKPEMLTPPQVWKGYNPDKGDFEEQIIREWDEGAIHYKEFYFSTYIVNELTNRNEKIKTYAVYAAPKGVKKLPAMMCIHGWGGAANIDGEFLKRGYAAMAYDYTGKMDGRKVYTIYPESLRYGNQNMSKEGEKPNPNVRVTSDYLWDLMARRAVSYLAAQPEVDPKRIGAFGYSYGGTVIWSLGMDKRLKAVCSFFGCGWNRFYRGRVDKYTLVPSTAVPTEDDRICLAGIEPEAYPPYVKCPVLFLSGTNDHHGNMDRSFDTFDLLPRNIPCRWAFDARAMHGTTGTQQDLYLWMDKYVKGEKGIEFPNDPKAKIEINAAGVPVITVTPEDAKNVESVRIYYGMEAPFPMDRCWRNAKEVQSGENWTAELPILDPNVYLFAFANVRYKSTIALTTREQAVVPSRIGLARATDKKSLVLYQAGDGEGCWYPVPEIVTATDGTQAMRAKAESMNSRQVYDAKWRGPKDAKLLIKVSSKDNTTFTIAVSDGGYQKKKEVQIAGSGKWQEITFNPGDFKDQNGLALESWEKARELVLLCQNYKDVTYREVRWVVGDSK